MPLLTKDVDNVHTSASLFKLRALRRCPRALLTPLASDYPARWCTSLRRVLMR